MASQDYLKLQNGSDIRGIALTGVKDELPNLTDVQAEVIARGILLWLSKKTGKSPDELTIAIGRDPRMSGHMIMHGLCMGFGPYGPVIYDCGVASTPAMFMASLLPDFDCDASIMITASHLPYNRNGFKLFTKEGGVNKEDIKEILTYANDEKTVENLGPQNYICNMTKVLGKKSYVPVEKDIMTPYCDILKDMIIKGVNSSENYETPLKGMKIVVDAGNGSGGFYAKDVLAPLGADISNSQYLEKDGTFPNHAPNPEDTDAMNSVCLQVITTGSDFGLIFDTDVDRSAAVDNKGFAISRNGIVAFAAALVAEEFPGTTVVTDSITSNQLTDFIENKLGMKHYRYKRGYRNVINKAIELNENGVETHLAIETSGHAAIKENYFQDDGAFLATKIVIKAAQLAKEGKKLDSFIADLENPAESKEFRFSVNCENFSEYTDQVLKDLKIWAQNTDGVSPVEPNYEGVRIDFDEAHGDGWCLLRKSLHDPIMPLNIESNRKKGISEISALLKEFFADYDLLDTSKL